MSPDALVAAFSDLIIAERPDGPVLDLASGDGRNGLFLAAKGVPVILADRSDEALSKAKQTAEGMQGEITLLEVESSYFRFLISDF